jgi:hypothetical protein
MLLLTMNLMMLNCAATQVDVDVALADGSIQSGRLESLAGEHVVITQAEGRREFAWSGLRQIRFSHSSLPADATQHAVLTDGTRLTISGIQSVGDQVTLQGVVSSAAWEIPRSQLQAVRLMALEGELEATWRDVAQSAPKSDMVVIRRQDQRLQSIEGVLGDVNEAIVKFQFEGEWIDVRRARVAGLVYAVPDGPPPGLPIGQLALTDSSELPVQRVELHDNQLGVITPNGSQFSFPLERVRHVDFAATSTVYLSDMDPETTTVRPYVLVPALTDANRRWYEPQRDRRLSREPFVATIEGIERSFNKGLGLHSHTEVVYRLAGNFRRFLAIAAVDSTDGQGQLEVIVQADGREVFRESFQAGEEPRPIDVDLSGVNRMHIVVDYGHHGDVGDQISLYDARFIK